jgi:hypothetical protein
MPRRQPPVDSGEIAFKERGAQMSKDGESDHPQIDEDALRNFILLTLPWLGLQQHILEILVKGMKDAGHIKEIENFTLRELQALSMIFDPSRTVRNVINPDFEKRLQDTFKEVVPKLTSASIQSLEAQKIITACMFDALKELRKGDEPGGRSGRKSAAETD